MDENVNLNIISIDQATPVAGSINHLLSSNALETSFEDDETPDETNATPPLRKSFSTLLIAEKTSTDVRANFIMETGLNTLFYKDSNM